MQQNLGDFDRIRDKDLLLEYEEFDGDCVGVEKDDDNDEKDEGDEDDDEDEEMF